MDDIIKVIDVEKAIRNSKSGFVKSLPGFIIRFIEKMIHQDEMNLSIHNNRDKSGVPFVNGILKGWNVDVVVNGGENIPDIERSVWVANHPLGGIDALSFLSTIYRFDQNVISPSNQLFNYIPHLKPVILGVNVFGLNTKETAEKYDQLYRSDSQIMIFPAGIVSRRTKGVISDLEWQKSFITKSIQHKRNIIPVHISGRNSNLFYFISNLRKFLGIKMSIEIILLPREMHKQHNSTVTMTIGKVIPWQTFSKDKTHVEWASYVKQIVYALAAD